MRLVGTLEDEKQVYAFYSTLSRMGIDSSYEGIRDAQTGAPKGYNIWVYDEDQIEEAFALFEKFKENPKAPEFQKAKEPPPPPPTSPLREDLRQETPPQFKVKVRVRAKRPLSHPLNNFLILICVLLYFWNNFQESKIIKEKGAIAVQIIMTPLQEALLFDYPASMQYLIQLVQTYPLKEVKNLKDLPRGAQALIAKSETTPSWKGLFGLLLHFPRGGWDAVQQTPLFEKIRAGEVWRLLTPTFLHRDFLHILFNMAWLWILGSQMEERMSKWKMLLFVLITGIISNVAQYLMSGPFFLGFSGVIVGMVAFIWMRQKLAPWEGYPLNKPTVIFILLFVLAMFVLEIVAIVLQLLAITDLSPNIANTAHIIGGLTGLLLGRLSFFARKSGRHA